MCLKLLIGLSIIGSAILLPLVPMPFAFKPIPNYFRISNRPPLIEPRSFNSKDTQNHLISSNDGYIEQQEIKNEYQNDESDLYPIYVLPPPNFQPVIYPNSRLDGVGVLDKNKKIFVSPMPRPYPYPYPHGFSSWILGGIRSLQRGSYWEQLASDLALQPPVYHPNHYVVYLKGTVPVGLTTYIFGGVKNDGKWQNEVSPPINSINTNIKTKLPVGLSSWFLGGMRDLSGRHWKLPDSLVQQVEFVPSNDKKLSDDDKKKNKYNPVEVKFDDDLDYNLTYGNEP